MIMFFEEIDIVFTKCFLIVSALKYSLSDSTL